MMKDKGKRKAEVIDLTLDDGEIKKTPKRTAIGHGKARVIDLTGKDDGLETKQKLKALAVAYRSRGESHGPTVTARKKASRHEVAESARVASLKKDRECSVCSDSLPRGMFPRFNACLHDPDTCHQCLEGWVKAQLSSVQWDRVSCPSVACVRMLSHDDLKGHLSDELFSRFDELATLSALRSIPDFRYCLSPTCSSGQIHNLEEDGNIFRCVSCGSRACTVHDMAFHEGETCVEYDERQRLEAQQEEQRKAAKQQKKEEDEMASNSTIQRTAMQCPRCKVRIEKNGGCAHMYCTQCKNPFNWNPLALQYS